MKNHKTEPIDENLTQRILLSEHRITLTNVLNARELGGYESTGGKKIKRGKLLRSGQLSGASTEDKRLLNERYRVGTVIDLRTPEEISERPDPLLFGANLYTLPVILDKDEEASTPAKYLKMMFGETAKKTYRRFFELVSAADEDRSVLFHGAFGKDRTGVAAALLLTLLDIPEETIIEDHMLSNKAFGTSSRIVYAHSLEYAFSTAKIEYGSVTQYLKSECGVTDENIADLKQLYLV